MFGRKKRAARKLEQEKKNRAYELIYNQLPEDMVDDLLSGRPTQAKHYSQVSIIFTDIVNFTKIAEDYRPKELVEILNKYFTRFDEISEKYNVERIKTIGDSYMGAAGCPIRIKENPVNAVLAAIEIQNWLFELEDKFKARNEDYMQLKIGINTGEAVAGIIGKFKHAFDVWGTTVNVAWRMQENCEAGKINISETTYNFVKPFFDTVDRGLVQTKHKGMVNMYYVTGIRKELVYKGKPNKLFWENIKLHFYSKLEFSKMEAYMYAYLEENLPIRLHYHSVAHTKFVARAAEKIAIRENIQGDDLWLIKTAAIFHDAGFIWQYEKNEPLGAKLAKEVLPNYGYSHEQIEKVCELILATRVPQKPKNQLERIICDADLFYLGNKNFHAIGDNLYFELKDRGVFENHRQWDEVQVKFLTAHQYHTEYAIKKARPGKLRHLDEIKTRLKNNDYPENTPL